LQNLMPFVGGMAHERAALERLPAAQVNAMLEAQLQRPAPMQFLVPMAVAQTRASHNPMGWSSSPGGAGDGRSMIVNTSDGYVGITSTGGIVGGPG
jgi:hypothetical protein